MFEWDEEKRRRNIEKHKLDFGDVDLMFDGRATATAEAVHLDELRFVTTAMVDRKFYTVVWTWRDTNRRIISFRRARHGEEKAFHDLHG